MKCRKCGVALAFNEGIESCKIKGCACMHVMYNRLLVAGGTRSECLCLHPDDDFLQRFDLIRLLGAGVHAVTVHAHDTLLDREIAIRILVKGNPLAFRSSFEELIREARAYAKIKHENVIRLHEISKYHDRYRKKHVPFLVMDMVDGKTLKLFIESQTLPFFGLEHDIDIKYQFEKIMARPDPLLVKIIDAIEYCHNFEVYHGDLHTGNIIMEKGWNPVIIDFAASNFLSLVMPERRKKADLRALLGLIKEIHGLRGNISILKHMPWHGRYGTPKDVKEAYLNCFFSVDARKRSESTFSSFPNGFSLRRMAYDEKPSGEMLRRERLSIEDIETGCAIEPHGVEEIVQKLIENQSVAVQGKPGSGKSTLASWAARIMEKKGRYVWAFYGRELQNKSVEEVCKKLEEVSQEYILLIDDIHLIKNVIDQINSFSWSSKRLFLLVGRSPYVKKASEDGSLPKIYTLITITDDNSSKIAEYLAIKLLGESKATQVLNNTGRDLVLTKWLLEGIVLDNKPLDFTPSDVAVDRLKKFVEEWGEEELRLYMTLAVFRSLELSCTENILSEGFGFKIKTIQEFHKKRLEAEIGSELEPDGSYTITLNRHPKLCKLFVEAAPLLGQTFKEVILEPTYNAVGIADLEDKSRDFFSVILGTALVKHAIDIHEIEEQLLQIGKRDEYINIIKMAISLLKARNNIPSNLEEKIFRLELAFDEYNGQRRLNGGEAARKILEETKRHLGVSEIPSGLYERRSYLLYQDAYVLRLGNSDKKALDRFSESASAAKEWGEAKNSPLHYGKAIQSYTAAATYQIDLAVFSGYAPGQLSPDRVRLMTIAEDLKRGVERLDHLLMGTKKEKELQELGRYSKNALLILAEASGWMGEYSAVEMCLTKLGKVTDLDEWRQILVILAKGTLAFAQKEYKKAIAELYDKHKLCLYIKGGENAGKIAVMLSISYEQIGEKNSADALRLWLLSNDCPKDTGNGLAKTWAQDFAEGFGSNLR